jgi:hypothetical protein
VDYVDTLLSHFKKPSDLQTLVGLAKQVPVGIATQEDRQKQNLLNQQAAKLGLTEKALRALGWAERTVPGYLQEPTQEKAKGLIADIVSSPHDVNVGKDDPLSLGSADLYSYETLQRWSPNKIAGLLNYPVPGKDQSTEATKIRARIRGDRDKLNRMTGQDVKTANEKAKLYEDVVEDIATTNKGNKFGAIYTRMMLSSGIKTFVGFGGK